MKYLVISLFALISFSAMADGVDDAVAQVEMANAATCTQVDQSFRKCLNTICGYTNEYVCTSDNGDFGLKVKVIEYTNFHGEHVVKARKVKIIR